MRVLAALPLRDAPLRVPRFRRVRVLVALLLATAILACRDAGDPTAPPPSMPSVGLLSGSVTLLGNDGPTYPTGNITLYSTQEDLERRISKYASTLHRRSGVDRVYDFVIDSIVPGDYYVLACWTIGCGEYRDAAGALRRVGIQAGRSTKLSFGL